MAFSAFPTRPNPWPVRTQEQEDFDLAVASTFNFYDGLDTWSEDFQAEAASLSAALVAANLPSLTGFGGNVVAVNPSGTDVELVASLKMPNGSAASPTYGFSGDTDAGMYLVGANELGFSVGGSLEMKITSTGIELDNTVSGDATIGDVNGTGIAFLDGGGSTGQLQFLVDDINVGFFSDAEVRLGAIYNSITASAANVFVAASGAMSRSTSALKYKDVVGIHNPDWIWEFAESAFDYLDKYADGEGPVYIGLAADDFANHPEGKKLVHFGADGEPEGLMYDRVAAVFMSAAAKRIRSLEERLSSLESR